MKNSIKISLFLLVVAISIFLLKPWATSDKLVGEEAAPNQVGARVETAPKGRSRAPASVGNPGEASGLSIRE